MCQKLLTAHAPLYPVSVNYYGRRAVTRHRSLKTVANRLASDFFFFFFLSIGREMDIYYSYGKLLINTISSEERTPQKLNLTEIFPSKRTDQLVDGQIRLVIYSFIYSEE